MDTPIFFRIWVPLRLWPYNLNIHISHVLITVTNAWRTGTGGWLITASVQNTGSMKLLVTFSRRSLRSCSKPAGIATSWFPSTFNSFKLLHHRPYFFIPPRRGVRPECYQTASVKAALPPISGVSGRKGWFQRAIFPFVAFRVRRRLVTEAKCTGLVVTAVCVYVCLSLAACPHYTARSRM